MSVDRMLREADRVALVADEISASYARELQLVLRDLEGELRRLAIRASQGSQTALIRAARAGALRQQIRTALTAAGFDDLAGFATSTSLDRLLTQISRLRIAADVADFTTRDSTRLLALKALAKVDLLKHGDDLAHAVWRTLVYGLFSERRLPDLLDDLAMATDREFSDARTLYDTAVSIFGRQVEALKATGDPDEPFAYLGPADPKNRPFCHAHVGQVFSRRTIESLDNGQLPNVFLTGGGYNCRHNWIEVSKFSELYPLVGTPQRIPEVIAQLEQAA